MSVSLNANSLIRKSLYGNDVSIQGTISTGSSLTNKNKTNSNSTTGTLATSKTDNQRNKKMHPQVIARKIAQGKQVSSEEKKYLRENYPDLYRKAMRANRLRENLEEALKTAKSETAKAAAVAEACTQACVLAAMDKSSQSEDGSAMGAGLYTDAIQAALSKYGSEKLSQEMEDMLKNTEEQEESIGSEAIELEGINTKETASEETEPEGINTKETASEETEPEGKNTKETTSEAIEAKGMHTKASDFKSIKVKNSDKV